MNVPNDQSDNVMLQLVFSIYVCTLCRNVMFLHSRWHTSLMSGCHTDISYCLRGLVYMFSSED